MSLPSNLCLISQYTASGAPDVPPEVQQVAIRLSNQICELLPQLTHHLLPWFVLTAALALLSGSLLLIRHIRVQNIILSGSRPSQKAGTRWAVERHRCPNHWTDSRIARANRQALRLASIRIKDGQLSN